MLKVRLHCILFDCILISSFFIYFSIPSYGQSPDKPITDKPIRAIWYQPTLEHSPTQGGSIVHIFGRTKSGIPITADVDNATVIRQTDPNAKVSPRAILTSVKSDRTGNFELIIELPYGLTQLPIVFNKYADTPGTPLLLTLQVSEQNVQLNVKISERPVKRVARTFENKYELSVGGGYLSFNESSNATGFAKQAVSSSGFTNFRFAISKINLDWWLKFTYDLSTLSQKMRKIQLESRYRILKNSRALWLTAGLAQNSFPIATVDANGVANTVGISPVNFVGGVGYYTVSTNWVTFTSVSYSYPFYLQVDAGALSYAPKYDLNLSTEIKYRYNKDWQFGVYAGIEYNSFSYDLVNSSQNISYKGADATTQVMLAFLTAHYRF